MSSILDILKEYWGHTSFRPLQEDIINSVLEGRDTLALLPTGGGKSICFQVPAMAKEGICLVISPLIALMKDQVETLRKKGIPALSIYSGMSFREVKTTLQNAVRGNYKFLYVSPERLETGLFRDFLLSLPVNLVAVDEAHCISQWGYDFRPPYVRIAALREMLPGVPVLALTASATQTVQDDICEKLRFDKSHQRFRQSFERPNLSYSVFKVMSRQAKLLEILNNVKGSAIVYCKTRKQTKDIAELLQLHGISADYYHAGLINEERNTRQENWINNNIRVMACTNAFGMGIDKPDVRTVVHYGVPDCLENYYQEAGRAGRDGQRSYAVLLYNDRELAELNLQPEIRYPDRQTIRKVYTDVMNYLQVPAGTGEQTSFNFDMAAFTSAFKVDLLKATYAIKALEQEDIVQFNEMFFKPSTAVFMVERNQLLDFEKQFPVYEPLIKGLLRSYEGIFSYPASVRENDLARLLRKEAGEVMDQLKALHQYGIIEYSARKDSPQLILLLNRMYNDSFAIDLDKYLLRKANFQKRIKAIIEYVKDEKDCRSRFIAAYFDDHEVRKCGICDNCLHQKTLVIGKEEFEEIASSIMKNIGNNQLTIAGLLQQEKKFRKEKLWKVIDYLQSERQLLIDRDGILKPGV